MKNTSEQLLSFAENELMKKESIRRAVLREAAQKQKQPIVWTKILLPIAACLVLALGTVFLIPSARAEVLRWFSIERPEQYLTDDPDERTPVEALDDLIIPAVTETPEGPGTPIGAVTDNRILYAEDDPIWQRIAEDFSIELGETMFDGDNLYVSVTLNGLTALPEVEAYTGGSATQLFIPVDRLSNYFESGVPDEIYLNGTSSLTEPVLGQYTLILDDGTEIRCDGITTLDANPEFMSVLDQLYDTYGEDPLSDADRETISRDMITWLNGKSLRGVVKRAVGREEDRIVQNGEAVPVDSMLDCLMEHVGEDGILRAAVRYRASAMLWDGDTKTFLEADLGTVCFDMTAYRRIGRDPLTATEPTLTFAGTEAIITCSEFVSNPDGSLTFTATNVPAKLDGLKLEAGDGAYIDGLGIHNIGITITMPGDWTDRMCEALPGNLEFYAEIDGERYRAQADRFSAGDHSCRFTLNVLGIPYDRIDSIRSFRLIPRLQKLLAMFVGETRMDLVPNVPLREPEARENVHWTGETEDLSDSALVFARNK